MAINMAKLPTQKQDLVLRVAKGHFATSHSHINYYIDVTMQKTRLSEARAVALELVSSYTHTTIVDTILCLRRHPRPTTPPSARPRRQDCCPQTPA